MKVSLVPPAMNDRHVAMFFWTSTDKDGDAFTCPDAEIERILRFGMKAAPVPHGSPWGHPSITFKVEDVPLFVVHQWQRHRTQNFSEKSFRYTEAKPKFYMPELADVRTQVGRPGHYKFETVSGARAALATGEMEHLYGEAYHSYSELIKLGIADELARAVLPAGLLTRMYATASLRNWLGFLVQRNDEHAQLEIRRCAEQVEAILTDLFPITMRIWNEYGRRVV